MLLPTMPKRWSQYMPTLLVGFIYEKYMSAPNLNGTRNAVFAEGLWKRRIAKKLINTMFAHTSMKREMAFRQIIIRRRMLFCQ